MPKVFARYLKDVLRVGIWRVGRTVWRVDTPTLRKLVANFRLAQARGVRIPVVWNHSDDARDQIGFIDNLFVRGPVLFASFRAAEPGDVRRLGVTVNEVSVEVKRPWRDGLGNLYDIALTHLGVVHLPVVPGQRPFVRLRLARASGDTIRFSFRKEHRLMNETPLVLSTAVNDAQVPSTADPKSDSQADPMKPAGKLDVGKLVRLVGRILKALGYDFGPASPDEPQRIVEQLESVAGELDPSVDTQGPAPDQTIEQLRLELERTREAFDKHRHQEGEERKQLYLRCVDDLVEQGKLAPADRPEVSSLGAAAGFRLSLLAPFARIPAGAAVPTDSIVRRFATAHEPSVFGAAPMTDERAKEIAATFG